MAHDNKEFSRENSKPYCESQITTCLVEPCFLNFFRELNMISV